MDMECLRREIDRIDEALAGLLAARMETAAAVRRFKTETLDEGRERAVLCKARERARAAPPLDPDFLESLYVAIMAESRRVQELGLRVAGFAGGRGGPAESAARALFPGHALVAAESAVELIAALGAGTLDGAVFAEGDHPDSSIEGLAIGGTIRAEGRYRSPEDGKTYLALRSVGQAR